ncbi:MAG: bifunctional adenosylcobinamide kinase/adenosylcobinamide-phosphate guanylyltransferase [Desulfobulbaceae bacterium]
MGEIILITGGSRSGKSAFAQRLAEDFSSSRLFLATCPVSDGEMAARIARHVADRRRTGWDTVEEEVEIIARLRQAEGYGVVLVDCLTLWVNNLLFRKGENVDEDVMAAAARELAGAARSHPGTVVFVTNEVGSGIVPENRLARLYRDLVGRLNQGMAAAADRVYLVSCGIPLQIKGNNGALQGTD